MQVMRVVIIITPSPLVGASGNGRGAFLKGLGDGVCALMHRPLPPSLARDTNFLEVHGRMCSTWVMRPLGIRRRSENQRDGVATGQGTDFIHTSTYGLSCAGLPDDVSRFLGLVKGRRPSQTFSVV